MPSPDAGPAQPAPWQVEPPRPADRGLVGRLLEDVVAEEPSIAPEVAAGTVRAGAWLQRERPSWSGVVVDPDQPTRTVVGYADVLAPSEGAATTRHLWVHPSYRDRGVHAALTAAAGRAVATLAGAAAALGEDDLLPDPGEVTYEPERVSPSRWRGAALGSGAIAAAGAVAVLAVQVASGPLGSALPFLSPLQRGGERVREHDPFACVQFLQRLDQGRPQPACARLEQGHFDPCGCVTRSAATVAQTGQPRGNDTGIVQDQPVAGPQP